MKRSLICVLAVFISLGMITSLFADQISLLGTVQLGKTIFSQKDKTVPVRFLIQNQSQDSWSYPAVRSLVAPVFTYQVYFLAKPGQLPTLVAKGNLQTTNAPQINPKTNQQTLDPGQSDIFAVGNIPLPISKSTVAAGFYRVYITAPTFKDNMVANFTVTPSAGGAFVVQ